MKNVKIYGKKNASVKNGKCQLKMLAFSIQMKVFHLLKENQFEPDSVWRFPVTYSFLKC